MGLPLGEGAAGDGELVKIQFFSWALKIVFPKTSGIVHLKNTQHLLWAFNQIKPQVQKLPLQLTCSVTLGKCLCPFGPQFPFLQNVGEFISYFLGCL